MREEREGEVLSVGVTEAGLRCSEWGPAPAWGGGVPAAGLTGAEVSGTGCGSCQAASSRAWPVRSAIHSAVFVERLLCAGPCAGPWTWQGSRQP